MNLNNDRTNKTDGTSPLGERSFERPMTGYRPITVGTVRTLVFSAARGWKGRFGGPYVPDHRVPRARPSYPSTSSIFSNSPHVTPPWLLPAVPNWKPRSAEVLPGFSSGTCGVTGQRGGSRKTARIGTKTGSESRWNLQRFERTVDFLSNPQMRNLFRILDQGRGPTA
jgi:hypothetical protein